MKILISDAFDAALPKKLEKFGEVTDDKSQVASADIILIRSKTKCTQEYIENAPNVKLIVRGGVGIDNIDTTFAKTKNILVNNTPKAPSIAVAELSFAMMIAVPNHLVRAHEGMKNGQWLKKELKRTELYKKKLCLIGMGNIAIEMAKRAKAFGMEVVAYRQSGKASEHAEVKSTLKEALEGADYVSIHTPLTDSTKDMINADAIGHMKNGVVVVNTGRGKCVEETAMVKALEDGKVATYATDVWPNDPPAEDYPILKAPNTLMIPHLGASSKENLGRIGDEVVSIIEEHIKGGRL